jgi:endonuclease-3
VPRTLEEMLSIPGAARKTANVVLGTAYGIASGVVVDTHVQRIAQPSGPHEQQTDPVKIEQDLIRIIPRDRWILFSHQVILHGRAAVPGSQPQMRRVQARFAVLLKRQDGVGRGRIP